MVLQNHETSACTPHLPLKRCTGVTTHCGCSLAQQPTGTSGSGEAQWTYYSLLGIVKQENKKPLEISELTTPRTSDGGEWTEASVLLVSVVTHIRGGCRQLYWNSRNCDVKLPSKVVVLGRAA